MHRNRWIIGGLVGLTLLGAAGASAQEAAAPASGVIAPSWSDSEFQKIAGMLTGSWRSTSPITHGTDSYHVVMSVAPVVIAGQPGRAAGVPDAMYVEVARADAIDRPYRQAVWQLHKVRGKTRLKTLEFRRSRGEMMNLVGLWAAPEAFPSSVTMNDLVATLDIELSPDGGGYKGATPHAYPTAAGGATEMTSMVAFDGTAFRSADRGYKADGSVAWGPADGEWYGFERVESPVKTDRMEGGLVALTYPSELEGEVFKAGDRMVCHYIGSLDNGYVFDSSYERQSPFQYDYGSRLVQGWTMGMADARKGLKRRLVIPPALAFADKGNPRSKVPPHATLFYSIEVVNIVPAPPPAPAPEVPLPVRGGGAEVGNAPAEGQPQPKPE
ncbi:MAG TPA: CpcT/CpeT family chromophore lyase [Phycisphaerales bacterium]|nr:CpcT/CpeT family chromophore lyase [Phycisphaerales bacterium]